MFGGNKPSFGVGGGGFGAPAPTGGFGVGVGGGFGVAPPAPVGGMGGGFGFSGAPVGGGVGVGGGGFAAPAVQQQGFGGGAQQQQQQGGGPFGGGGGGPFKPQGQVPAVGVGGGGGFGGGGGQTFGVPAAAGPFGNTAAAGPPFGGQAGGLGGVPLENPNPENHYVLPALDNSDGISCIRWSPNPQHNILVATSWDGTLRFWDFQNVTPPRQHNGQKIPAVIQSTPRAQASHSDPLLCCCFSSNGQYVFTGGCDNAVRVWDLQMCYSQPTQVTVPFGMHEAPVKGVAYLNGRNGLIVSGGWDAKIKVWSVQAAITGQKQAPLMEIQLEAKIFAMDCKNEILVVALENRKIKVFSVDPNPNAQPLKLELDVESILKYQTRTVSVFTNEHGVPDGFAIGSIEGRVGIQYFAPSQPTKDFAFRCHRVESQNKTQSTIYPVNDIGFHNFGTFSTVGGDGVVNFWDKGEKQRLKTYLPVSTSISAGSFNSSGTLFAYARSYDWSKGAEGYAGVGAGNNGVPANAIQVMYVEEGDIKQKKKGHQGSGGGRANRY